MKDTTKTKKLMVVVWNMGIGGIQTLLHEVIIYASKNQNCAIYLLIKNHEDNHLIDDLLNTPHVYVLEHNFLEKPRFIRAPHFVYWIIVNYIKINPSIVLTFLDHLSFFMVVLKHIIFWRKVRLVLNENVYTARFIEINRKPVWLWKTAIRFFYRYADCIIVPTVTCKKNLEHGFGIPASMISIIPNWTLSVLTHTRDKIYDLIYVGRFEKEKNIYGILSLSRNLIKKIPHAKICLVGKGKMEVDIREYIGRNNLVKNIYLTGYKDDVIPLLSKSKIFLMTTYNEGMPVALLEAGSQCLPAVVSNFHGANEIIQQGVNGYISKSEKEMLQGVVRLLTNKSLRMTLGKNAQMRVRELYGKKNMVHFVKKVFEE